MMNCHRPTYPTIEALEDRIAPAGVNDLLISFSSKTATYTDGDGDRVTVKITKGILTPANFMLVPGAVGSDLAILDLSGADFTDSNLTITAKKSKTAGDGKAHVGFLNAGTHDLGTVQIPGDLSDLVVGDSAGTVLKSLTVQSVGVVDVAGALRAGSPTLDIVGDVGKIIVKGDVKGRIQGRLNGGSVTVGGSLIGGNTDFAGSVTFDGDCDSVKIGGDLIGAAGGATGYVRGTNLGSVTVGGSLLGGSGVENAGRILAYQSIDVVKIGGSVIGGTTARSGGVTAGGNIGKVTITGDVAGSAESSGSVTAAKLGTVKIGGALKGGGGDFSGLVQSSSTIETISVGKDIVGGAGKQSGQIITAASVKSITVKGGVLGGGGIGAGTIVVNATTDGISGSIKVGGDVQGGAGESSGKIASIVGALTSVKIKGSVTGAVGDFSGSVFVAKSLGLLQIGGDVIGGAGGQAGSIVVNAVANGISGPITIGGDLRGAGGVASGMIWSSEGSLQAVTVKGSAIAGAGVLSGSILAGNNLGSVKIAGDVTGTAANNFTIRAGGTGVAIGTLQVGGTVTYTQVLAGFGVNNTPVNGGVEIGKVTVGRDWVASSISAGFTAGLDGKFGTADDTRINTGQLGLVPRIASITIKGALSGTPAAGDNFGFVAREIGSMKIGRTKVALTTGTDVIDVSGGSGDVFVREVP